MGRWLIKGRRVLLDENTEICPACLVISGSKVTEIHRGVDHLKDESGYDEVFNAGDLLVMPGVIDPHVHVNEPGRTEWEGYETATKAAAAGGITTIVDMPLNCSPVTTSVEALQTKLNAARGKCHVDVAFWGGIVPGNQAELKPMIAEGVVGFKSFLIHSGLDEFPSVTEADVRTAMAQLRDTNTVYLFHAEVEVPPAPPATDAPDTGDDELDVRKYDTFLNSRSKQMENDAVKLVCDLCLEYHVRCHIVHLSSAEALPTIRAAQAAGAPITVETCHHYLSLISEKIRDGETEFKCCPPVREKSNQEDLWAALKDEHIDMVVSDHSPCTANLKQLDTGNFMSAWGGISSLQFGLALMWTGAQFRGFTLQDVARLLCKNTAKLCRLEGRKGSIAVGHDADIVIWDPFQDYTVKESIIKHKNKITPYLGFHLQGLVHRTIVRGKIVYEANKEFPPPIGNTILLGH